MAKRILKSTAPELYNKEVMLQAAARRRRKGDEFSEWQWTVWAWTDDPFRFGLRGFEDHYPDHGKTKLEMLSAKASGIRASTRCIPLGWIEPVRPNHFRVTALGKSIYYGIRERDSVALAARSDFLNRWLEMPEIDDWDASQEVLLPLGAILDLYAEVFPQNGLTRAAKALGNLKRLETEAVETLKYCDTRDLSHFAPHRKRPLGFGQVAKLLAFARSLLESKGGNALAKAANSG